MKYLLDANAVIALLNGREPFLSNLRRHRPGDFGVPSIVAYELFFGAFRSRRRQENLRRIDDLRFTVVDFDREDARVAGELRARLAEVGTPIGPYDVLIAGQALARGLIVVTNNMREFARVPGLSAEDWQA